MKMAYTNWAPRKESLDTITKVNGIIEEYSEMGYTLTLRQLYYQFVARGLIENSERSYKNLGSLVTKGRMAGLISWEAIEDRNRGHYSFWYEENMLRPVENLPRYIRFDKWDRQDVYVEVWVEKEALGNVIQRACEPLLVPHMACKGYLSASEAWRAGRRFGEKVSEGKKGVIIHLGDHDPSGIDMTRDNRDRVGLFSEFPEEVEIVRLALNMDQVKEYTPPPNPTKITDSRARGYIKKFGHTSWELDALEPSYLEEIISLQISHYIDTGRWDSLDEEEAEMKRVLGNVYERWHEIERWVR